LTIFKH